jgi:hypothetical protein
LFSFVAVEAVWTWPVDAAVLLLVVPVSCVHPARKTPAIKIADTTRMMVIVFFIGLISVECEGTSWLFNKKPAGPLGLFALIGFLCVLAYSG